ncbi:aldolase [Cytobacillus firmus]|nr:aldolase [Cytobacillus firmus]
MIKTLNNVKYKAFGLGVLSEINMPELTQASEKDEGADIVIKVADLTNIWGPITKQGKFIVSDNRVIFQVVNTAIFCIQNGKEIIVSPMQGSDEDKIRLYILGSCMGALLMQRNMLPLHGSAIAINGKAYAFIGESGAGKSTLASVFLKSGYQLLSDDVIAISSSQGGTPYVIPSYPQQKLWQESLHEFGMETGQFRPLFERETKYAIPVPNSFYKEPLPLAGVFELVKTEAYEVEINPISSLQRLHTLFNHTYRKFLIDRLGLREWHFKLTANIVNKIDVYQLQRPINRFTANDLTSMILKTINKG